MIEILKTLLKDPVVKVVLIMAFICLVLMYAIAFLQGREISFGPPKIGPKPTHPVISENNIELNLCEKDGAKIVKLNGVAITISIDEFFKKGTAVFLKIGSSGHLSIKTKLLEAGERENVSFDREYVLTTLHVKEPCVKMSIEKTQNKFFQWCVNNPVITGLIIFTLGLIFGIVICIVKHRSSPKQNGTTVSPPK